MYIQGAVAVVLRSMATGSKHAPFYHQLSMHFKWIPSLFLQSMLYVKRRIKSVLPRKIAGRIRVYHVWAH